MLHKVPTEYIHTTYPHNAYRRSAQCVSRKVTTQFIKIFNLH